MEVGIILTPYGEGEPSGLSAFVLNLTLALVKQHPKWDFIVCIKGVHDTSIFGDFDNVTIEFLPNNFLWKDVAYIKNKQIDVWLYNNPSLPLFFKPKNSVLTALDFGIFYPGEKLGFFGILKQRFLKYLQYSAIQKTNHVLCTSLATKNDLHRFFPSIALEKVSVVMCGFTRVCDKYKPAGMDNLPAEYYLVVGVIKPRKNQLTAVRAFIEAKKKGLKSKLIICGKGKGRYFDEIMSVIKKSDYAKDISYLGYCTNEELVTLYLNARALIFPSHVEGFGMPIVESMSCGVPVISSSNGAQGEVADGFAITVDSSDVRGFSAAILELQNDAKRDQYRKKGLGRAQEFSWEKSAKEYAEIFKMILSDQNT